MTAVAVRPAVSRPAATRPVRSGAPAAGHLLHGLSRRSAPLPKGPAPTAPADAESRREEIRRARSLAAVVAVACVEVETGRRPLRDLSGWLGAEAFEKMTRRMDLLTRTGAAVASPSAPRPVGARVCEVAPGRIEASATVVCDGRARAFALRMERRLSRWRVTAVEIG